MVEKILFVDDEPAVLDGYMRLLHREFKITKAVGAKEGLMSLLSEGPYAVVVSDMRMPEMNGAQFLAEVRRRSPNTVRMLLTGYADIEDAIQAVNEGNITRFLSKPCEKSVLVDAVNAGLAQYRTVAAERELVEKVRELAPAGPATAPPAEGAAPVDLLDASQGRFHFAALLAAKTPFYAVILRMDGVRSILQRYGNSVVDDYLHETARELAKKLAPRDRLYRCDRDTILAFIQNSLPPLAMRAELAHILDGVGDFIFSYREWSTVIPRRMSVHALPGLQFSSFDGMLAAVLNSKPHQS